MTHLKAKALFKAGKTNEAWDVAQQDEGWIGQVSREDWTAWMHQLVAA
jgi:hypothetical protein|tara:strand:+ start:524 stop:667 length:144 start_codon:yes stop_codon:yes gene_type:complete